ncbi:response regulator [Pacificibacter maritimus]|uniref:response regulator n=1 Tax=Pacificibacter maritimus TaxID=762213 RepID=UPI001473820A|nr:response regulator [Pacificibacter maritimus]
MGIETIAYGSVDPASRTDARRLTAATSHLGRLINEALSMAAGHDAALAGITADTNVRTFLQLLTQRWAYLVAASGVELDYIADPSLPASLEIDILSVERILSNLVSNALRHSQTDRIEISATYDTGQELRIAVRDWGIGLTEPQLETLFDFTLPQSTDLGKAESGYGLRIAHDLTRRLGGEIAVSNAAPQGACFSVSLPARVPPPETQLDRFTDIKSMLNGLSALIVDDATSHRLALRLQLEAAGMIVDEADSAFSALALLERTTFDVILLDIEMPVFSGLDLLRELHKKSSPTPPVIGVTAHAFEANHLAITQAGAKAVLNKPATNQQVLYPKLLKALGLNLMQPVEQPDIANGKTVLHNFERMIDSLPRDARMRYLDHLAQDFKAFLDRADQLAHGDLSPTDRDNLGHASHALAGLFATSYAQAAHRRALELEQISNTADGTQVLALLQELRQDVAHIISTINLLKLKK